VPGKIPKGGLATSSDRTVRPNIISAKGFGDTHPVAPNDTPADRAKNRRIEITVQGPQTTEKPVLPRDPRLINVLYATNREIDGPAVGEINAKEITDKRSPILAYGSAAIRVPEAHKIGRVERPSDSDITFLGITISKSKEDEKKHFTDKHLIGLSKTQFIEAIRRSKNNGVMLFVHGIATAFDDAIFKTAQIAFDTNFPGVPIAFAWPAKEGWTDYDYDRESALFSQDAFLDTLRLIHDDAEISKVYVIARSMGNQIVVDALAHAQDSGIGITELVMAAPDIDSDVFRSMVTRLRRAAKGLTLYVSSADRAMLASRIKAGGAPRAGGYWRYAE